MKTINLKQKLISLLTVAAAVCWVGIKKADMIHIPIALKVRLTQTVLAKLDIDVEKLKAYFWNENNDDPKQAEIK